MLLFKNKAIVGNDLLSTYYRPGIVLCTFCLTPFALTAIMGSVHDLNCPFVAEETGVQGVFRKLQKSLIQVGEKLGIKVGWRGAI